MSKPIGFGRFLVLAAVSYLLVLSGLLTLTGGLLAIAVPLVVYFAATLLAHPPKLQLSAERTISADTVLQNTPVNVTVKVTNDGPDLDEVLIQDILPQAMTLT